MRRFTTRDVSTGEVTREDKGLSLQSVNGITDWTEFEFDTIADLDVGQHMTVSGIQVERTA